MIGKLALIICVVFCTGCDFPVRATPEQMATERDKCLEQGFDYHIGDWGHILCSKPE